MDLSLGEIGEISTGWLSEGEIVVVGGSGGSNTADVFSSTDSLSDGQISQGSGRPPSPGLIRKMRWLD